MTTPTPHGQVPAIQRYEDHAAAIRTPHVQTPAEIEHVAGDVSKNVAESNMSTQQPAPADPMDWPLPCDVTVGHGTMRKGVSLRTLVTRMKVLYEMATGNSADEVANRTPEENTALADAFRARIGAAHQPSPTAQADSQPAPVREHDLQDVRCECCGYMTYHLEHTGCIRAARAPAESVTAPGGGVVAAGRFMDEAAERSLKWDTPPAEQQAAQVIIDFSQVGTAGPFPVANGRVSLPDATMQDLARMLRPTYEAEQQAAPKAAPGVGNSGFDHKTATDLLNNKTVSDEAVRKFVAASRWAHDERAALSATLLAMHGVLTSREAEIALLKKALMEAEAAPQQEPSFWTRQRFGEEREFCEAPFTTDWTPLYTAPQPAPAPLSDDVSQKTWALLDELEKLRGANRDEEDWDTLNKRDDELRAALAAQGGKDA